jgi:hypothetical protein
MKLSVLRLAVLVALATLGSFNDARAQVIDLTITEAARTRWVRLIDFGTGEVEGYISTDNGVSWIVTADYQEGEIQITGMGRDVIQVTRSPSETLYRGFIGSSEISVDVDHKNSKMKFGGDGFGAFDDFSGKSTLNEQLVLFWGKNRLELNASADTDGDCSGTVRVGNTVTHTLTCRSVGSFRNVFFNSPDLIVTILARLLILE